MKTLKNIKNYSLGFVVGVACVSSIAYGASNGSIGALFTATPGGSETGWRLVGSNIQDGTVGSSELGTDSVVTTKIADGNVTLLKLAANSVDSSKIVDGSVSTADIGNSQVTTTKIADGNVTLSKLASDSVDSSKIVDGSVSTADIGNSQVTTTKIADSQVTTTKIADSNVTTTKIADSNVTTLKIADGNVTQSKVLNGYIDLLNNQTIGGVKTFTSNMTLPGAPTAWYNLNVGSIGSTTTYAYTALCSQNSNGDCTGNGGVVLGLANSNAGVNFATSGNSFVNNGNFGVGTNSPSFRLDVNGQARATGGFVGNLTGNADTVTNGVYTNNAQTITGQKTFSSQILANGGIQSTSFIYTSDRRFKENIKTIQSPLQTVQALRGVTWNWKKDGKADVGFIAQEVEEVLPELVYTDKNGYKGVQYGNMVGLLVEAVKEQQKQIDELNAKLNALQK